MTLKWFSKGAQLVQKMVKRKIYNKNKNIRSILQNISKCPRFLMFHQKYTERVPKKQSNTNTHNNKTKNRKGKCDSFKELLLDF